MATAPLQDNDEKHEKNLFKFIFNVNIYNIRTTQQTLRDRRKPCDTTESYSVDLVNFQSQHFSKFLDVTLVVIERSRVKINVCFSFLFYIEILPGV